MKFKFFIIGLFALCKMSNAQNVEHDPYQWLEDISGKKSIAWVKKMNAQTRAQLGKDKSFITLRHELQTILDAKTHIPYVSEMNGYYYNFWTDDKHIRGIWRRTTLEEYRKHSPQWETILDLDALAKQEKENWVYSGSQCRQPDYNRCLILLSRGGADATVAREFDIQTKRFVKQGFVLPESKMHISWSEENSIFVATDWGSSSMTDSGYPRIVKEWHRGTPLSSAKTIFEGKKTDIVVAAYRSEQHGFKRDIVLRQISFQSSEKFIKEGTKLTKLDVPPHSEISFFNNQILIMPREDWLVGNKTWALGSVLAIDFEQFMKGSRDFTMLFTPSEKTSFIGKSSTQNYLLIQSLDNIKNHLDEWQLVGGKWVSRNISLPTVGSLSVDAVNTDTSDHYFLSYSDYLTPDVLLLAKAGHEQREVLKSTPAFFNAAPYEAVQYEAISNDGVRIPYFVVKPKDMKFDGKNPTLLYGYGGFQELLQPEYSAIKGKAWLEKGGVYVEANIRGGGEFGPRWHQAALKQNRQRAYDDFAAVAEDLIARQITSPAHLGAMGGSNGGLLAGVMLTQRPDLFHAIVSQVPLLDMRRYNQLLAGASWMDEYGNPDVPEEWAYIKLYSPYHQVKSNVVYPNVLFTTSTRDDRVHPGHARKMTAKMLGLGHHNVWYYENIEGGHAGATNNAQAADINAIEFSFLWRMLKWGNEANATNNPLLQH